MSELALARVRMVAAEGLGTAFLVAGVIGSGIFATRLAPGQPGLQLLVNAIATGALLVALIVAFGPVSAAFNPVVTLVERTLGRVTTPDAAAAIAAQVAGGAVGAIAANLMFDLPAVTISGRDRVDGASLFAEVVATLGLVLTVYGALRSSRVEVVAVAVGGYITAAYWFTSSTSFANPAVTIARTLSDTFAGIAPASVAPFVLAQLVGGALAAAVVLLLHPTLRVHPAHPDHAAAQEAR